MDEYLCKNIPSEKATLSSPKYRAGHTDTSRQRKSFLGSSKLNDSVRKNSEKKRAKIKKLLNNSLNKNEKHDIKVSKPSFKEFLYNKFSPFYYKSKEPPEDEFKKFTIVESKKNFQIQNFKIPKIKKPNGSIEINSYFDVIYKGANDNYNSGSPTSQLIENRVENTFKFNSEKVIDSLLRSNKHLHQEESTKNDSSKPLGFSPLRKVRNIFKRLKTQDSKSKENSHSTSLINDDDRLNNKMVPNSTKRNSAILVHRMSNIFGGNTSNYAKQDTEGKNKETNSRHIQILQKESIESFKININPNNNINTFNSKILRNTKHRLSAAPATSLNILNNLLNNAPLNSDVNPNKDNLYFNNNRESPKDSINVNKNNLNTSRNQKKNSFQTSNFNSLKILQKKFNSFNSKDSIESKIITDENLDNNKSSLTENTSNNINNNNKNFVLKNILQAKSFSRKKKVGDDSEIFNKNLKRKINSLLHNDCQKFCLDLKNKNSNFNEKITNHLISEKFEDSVKKYNENFHFKGMSFNPVRYVVNLDSIEKNFLTPDEVILEKITPQELKIIQSDVNYYIKDKAWIKENAALKIKSLMEILKEEEEQDKNTKNKVRLLTTKQKAERKYQEKLRLIKSGNVEEVFLLSESTNNSNGRSRYKKKFHPLHDLGIERGLPRSDLIDLKYEKMFFSAYDNVNRYIIKENIAKDEFKDFNVKVQDQIFRDIHDNNYIANQIRYGGDNIEEKQTRKYYLSKALNRNDKYEHKVEKTMEKAFNKFEENNFLKISLNKIKHIYNENELQKSKLKKK